MFKSKLIISVILFALSGQAVAGGAGGKATEATQIMNNGELMASVSKQSQLVAGQIRDYSQQVQQYMTMVQNLKNMPANVISEHLAPYKDTLRDLGDVYKATVDVYDASKEGYDVIQRRTAEMKALSMSPEEYLNAEIALAKTKGGIYKAQADRDIKAFQNAQSKSEKLASMGDEIGRIEGAVHGLALLSQLNQAQTGEMMELNAQIREKNLEDTKAKIATEEAYAKAARDQKALMALREKQDAEVKKAISIDKDKWSYIKKRDDMIKEKFGGGNGK